MENNLMEAFEALRLLESDEIDFSSVDQGKIDELKAFVDDDVDVPTDDEPIIDLNAYTEEELQDTYDGKIVCACAACGTRVYKDKDDIEVDEEAELVNVGEACPNCDSKLGFKICGKIEKLEKDELKDDEDEEESSDEDFEDEESKEVVDAEGEEDDKKAHESLAYRVARKHLTEAAVAKRSSSQAVADLLRANGIDINEEADGVGVYEALGKSDVNALVADEKEAITGYNRALKKGPSKKAADRLSEIRDDEKEHIKELKDVAVDESMLNEAPEGYDYERVSTPASRWQDIEDWRTPDVIEDAVNNYARMMTGVLRNSDYTHQRLVRLYEAIETVADKFKTTYEDIGAWILEHRYSIPMEDCADTWCVDSSCYILSADDAACIRITEDSADIIENNFGFMNTTNGVMIDRSTAANMIAESFESWREFISWLEDTVKLLPGAVNRLFKSAYANLDSYIDAHEGIRESIDFHASNEDDINVSKADDGSVNISIGSGSDAEVDDFEPDDIPVGEDTLVPLDDEDKAEITGESPEGEFDVSDEDFDMPAEAEQTEETPVEGEEEHEEESSEDYEEESEEKENKGANESYILNSFDEVGFDTLCETFLRKTYSNVKSYKTNKIDESVDNTIISGTITFKSGKALPTNFVFESAGLSPTGKKLYLTGYNESLSATRDAIRVKGSYKNKNFEPDGLNYKYISKAVNESLQETSVKIEGSVKL